MDQHTDPRPVYEAAQDWAADLLGAVRPGQWEVPTPCPEFTVRELAGHLLAVLDRARVVAEGGDVNAQPQVIRDVSGDDFATAFRARLPGLRAAWTDSALAGEVTVRPESWCPARLACGSTPMRSWFTGGIWLLPPVSKSRRRQRWPNRSSTGRTESSPRSAAADSSPSTRRWNRGRRPGRPSSWPTGTGIDGEWVTEADRWPGSVQREAETIAVLDRPFTDPPR